MHMLKIKQEEKYIIILDIVWVFMCLVLHEKIKVVCILRENKINK